METATYKLDQFEGPLDLLLMLIQKNKVNIQDIPIAIICDQYLEFIKDAQEDNMEIAGDFIVMASELMLIKSKMLLPHEETGEADPRKELADAVARYQQAKEGAQKMAPLYQIYNGRFVKDTDELSTDNSYVSDQSVTYLCAAVRRIIAANESRPKNEKQVFAPLVAKPIVPVDVKIVGILHHMSKKKSTSMKDLLHDAVSLNDMIAIFLGILELVKVQKILIDEDDTNYVVIHGAETNFIINDNPPNPDEQKKTVARDPNEFIPLSSRAEMHREQRRIIREQKLAEKKRLREEERQKRKAEALANQESMDLTDIPADDSDLEKEAQIAELLDAQLSEREDDLLDDLGLDMETVVEELAKEADKIPQLKNDDKEN